MYILLSDTFVCVIIIKMGLGNTHKFCIVAKLMGLPEAVVAPKQKFLKAPTHVHTSELTLSLQLQTHIMHNHPLHVAIALILYTSVYRNPVELNRAHLCQLNSFKNCSLPKLTRVVVGVVLCRYGNWRLFESWGDIAPYVICSRIKNYITNHRTVWWESWSCMHTVYSKNQCQSQNSVKGNAVTINTWNKHPSSLFPFFTNRSLILLKNLVYSSAILICSVLKVCGSH